MMSEGRLTTVNSGHPNKGGGPQHSPAYLSWEVGQSSAPCSQGPFYHPSPGVSESSIGSSVSDQPIENHGLFKGLGLKVTFHWSEFNHTKPSNCQDPRRMKSWSLGFGECTAWSLSQHFCAKDPARTPEGVSVMLMTCACG